MKRRQALLRHEPLACCYDDMADEEDADRKPLVSVNIPKVHNFVVHKVVNLGNILYICTRKDAHQHAPANLARA